jgi:LacI family transcriptional regulator
MPSDLSLVGFDDMEWWTLTHPPLTTVGQPVYDLGREAMRLLLGQIGREKARRPQRVVLKPELILRDSCGPPSRRSRSIAVRRRTRALRPPEGRQ